MGDIWRWWFFGGLMDILGGYWRLMYIPQLLLGLLGGWHGLAIKNPQNIFFSSIVYTHTVFRDAL